MCIENKFKIGYFADGQWAHRAIEKILNDNELEIGFICVRNDKKDEKLQEYGKKYNIPVIWHENINSVEFKKMITPYKVDIFVSMSFNQIFKTDMINFPPYKTINCHAGNLPFYRGRNVLNWVLINDETEFGITVHYVDEGIDTGDIILQKLYPITDNDNYQTLLERAYTGCAELLYEAIKNIQKGDAKRIKQSTIDPIGIYCGMRKAGDEIIEWNQTSREIFNFVRAITSPGPCARCYINGDEVKIIRVKEIVGVREYKGIPGQIIGKDEEGIWVKTKDTFVKVIALESSGKIKVGDRFTGRKTN